MSLTPHWSYCNNALEIFDEADRLLSMDFEKEINTDDCKTVIPGAITE